MITSTDSPSYTAPGTTMNQAGLDTTGAGNAMEFSPSGGNSATFQFSFNSLGLSNLSLSLANVTIPFVCDGDGCSPTDPTQVLQYSVNGGAFETLGSIPVSAPYNYATTSLNFGTDANNAANITVKDVLTAPSGDSFSATFDIDNIQVNGDAPAVPEPGTLSLCGIALGAAAVWWRRRARSLITI